MSAWQDNKVVTIAATNSDPSIEQEVTRKQKDGTCIAIRSPQSVALYNKFMGGVAYNGQLTGYTCTYYHVRLKCRKFTSLVFVRRGSHKCFSVVCALH